MTFKAEGKQTGMMAKDLFGDKNYHIDPNGDEPVFKRLIDLRTVAKAEDNEGKEQGIKILASATSYGITIEFILEDRITDDLYGNGTTHSRVITPVQTHINQQLYPFKKISKSMLGEDNVEEVKVEKPGSYAAPWGPLIPAAGRLMLAIAEQLAADRGIPYGLCDTDSMYFVRPQGMERDDFRQGVKEITGWFQTLMPYEDKSESLFNIEKHNYRLKRDEQGNVVRKEGKPEIVKGEFEPLYLLAVSAKRYGQANFHECADGVSVFNGKRGNWVLRKVSGHGLGHITAPRYNYKAVVRHNKTGLPEHDAAPQLHDNGKPVFNKKGEIIWQHGSICKGQNPRLFLDLWRAAFEEVCSYDGKPNPDDSVDVQRHGLFASADDRFEDWLNHRMNRFIETMPGLEQPQMVQRSLSTANDMRTYNNLPNKAPGSFFNTFPQPMMSPMFDQIAVADLIKLKEFKMSSLYAHGGKDIDVSTIENAKRYGLTRRDNGQFPVEVFEEDWGIKLKTVAESLNKYFVHPEFKSQGKVGQLAIRNVVIVNHTYSGKKANRTIEIPEDLTPDDEDSLNKLSVTGWLNISLMKKLGAKPIAELLEIGEDRVKRTLFKGLILSRGKMAVLTKSIRFNRDGRPHLLIEAKRPFKQLDLPKTKKVKECKRLIGVIYKRLAKDKGTDTTFMLDYIMRSYSGPGKDREIVSTYVEDFIRCWLGEKWMSAPNEYMDTAIELVHVVSGAKRRREQMRAVKDKYNNGHIKRKREKRLMSVADRKAAIAALTPPVYFIDDVRGEPIPISPESREHKEAWEFTCRHATAANYEEMYTTKLDRIYKRKQRLGWETS
jgi:hypothetical protein